MYLKRVLPTVGPVLHKSIKQESSFYMLLLTQRQFGAVSSLGPHPKQTYKAVTLPCNNRQQKISKRYLHVLYLCCPFYMISYWL